VTVGGKHSNFCVLALYYSYRTINFFSASWGLSTEDVGSQGERIHLFQTFFGQGGGVFNTAIQTFWWNKLRVFKIMYGKWCLEYLGREVWSGCSTDILPDVLKSPDLELLNLPNSNLESSEFRAVSLAPTGNSEVNPRENLFRRHTLFANQISKLRQKLWKPPPTPPTPPPPRRKLYKFTRFDNW